MDFDDFDLLEMHSSGSDIFDITLTNTAGDEGKETVGKTTITYNDDDSITTSSIYDGQDPVTGEGQHPDDPLDADSNPDAEKYKHWEAGTDIYWTEDDTSFSGVFGDDHKHFSGVYDRNDGTDRSGTFEAKLDCDVKCQAAKAAKKTGDVISDGVNKAADAAKKGAEAINEKLHGENGVWYALGGIGGLLVVGVGLYCCCCKKDKDLMSEGREGGQKQNKVSLLA